MVIGYYNTHGDIYHDVIVNYLVKSYYNLINYNSKYSNSKAAIE